MQLHSRAYYTLFFFAAGVALVFMTRGLPIADFGNYYYGSRLYLEGKFSLADYTDIHHFNEQIKNYGETAYFENYTPVPPFSLLFYLPFCTFKAMQAKLLFNLLSLSLFCFSLYRLLRFLRTSTPFLWALPFILLYPLYANIIQGQSYLLITALLMESYLSYERKRHFVSAVLLSLTVCLKIFTVFILLYFLLRKDFRFAGYFLFSLVVFWFMTFLAIDSAIVPYYISDILPRLAKNEVLEPYHYSSQGFHTFLMKLFSYDKVQNPSPLFDSPLLILFLESIFAGFIVTGLWLVMSQDAKPRFFHFSLTLLCCILFSRHSAGYSLLLVVPLCISVMKDLHTSRQLLVLALIAFAVNLPPSLMSSQMAPLQFLRLWCFLVVFVLLFLSRKPIFSYRLFASVSAFFLITGFFLFREAGPEYFLIQNSRGALSDYSFSNDTLKLRSCYGAIEVQEQFAYRGKIEQSKQLQVKENVLLYNGSVICNTPDHKLKPMLLNDTSVLFLSDLKQGVGFYKLRVLPLEK